MCSTCNYKNFVGYEVTHNGKPVMVGDKPVTRLKSANAPAADTQFELALAFSTAK